MNKKISVIIPAKNEEKLIAETIISYRNQHYSPLEIIVVSDGSTDKTFEISQRIADKVIHNEISRGPSAARNQGVKVASGDIFIFSDADTYLTAGGVENIAQVVHENTIGIPLGKPREQRLQGTLFFFYKNLGHQLGFYKSAIFGVIFCHRSIFEKIRGFDESKKIAEYADFIKRAKKAGARYRLIDNFYAVTSLRRFEERGYLKEYTFWITWRIASWLGKGKPLEDQYFK